MASANALVLPDFNVGRADWTHRKNAGAQIQANKDFISADVNAWVTSNYSTHFKTYAEAKCTRDSGLILDAMTYDVMYGGDAMMTYMAKSFFDAGVSQLTTATERTVVALAYNHLASIVSDIVQEITVTAQSGNTETQDRSGTGANAAIGTLCQDLMQLVEDAIMLEKIGCFAIVLEKVPSDLANKVAEKVKIPVIGIGAGNKIDGQVLVIHDMLGMTKEFNPRFLRRYMNLYDDMIKAISKYSKDVKNGNFPNSKEQY